MRCWIAFHLDVDSHYSVQQKQTTTAPEQLPNDATPCVQLPLKSWDPTRTERLPPVKVPLPSVSNADADSARDTARSLSQPPKQPAKPAKPRKSETGPKPKPANDKISKLSSMVRSHLRDDLSIRHRSISN